LGGGPSKPAITFSVGPSIRVHPRSVAAGDVVSGWPVDVRPATRSLSCPRPSLTGTTGAGLSRRPRRGSADRPLQRAHGDPRLRAVQGALARCGEAKRPGAVDGARTPSVGSRDAAAQLRRREGAADTPHYQILLRGDDGASFRGAVNVLSQEAPSELLYLVDEDLRHPVTASLEALGAGWHPLRPRAGAANLDYVRANLFDRSGMRSLPPDASGPDNDLADVLDHYVQRAIADDAARVSIFGQRWGPEPTTKDKVFGFLPGEGVHDVHMNQGNDGVFVRDDGVWQDGGLLLHFPTESRWVGIFLAFQSQSWHTDDATGHAISVPVPPAGGDKAAVRILAAMVNPVGPAPERESVLILNASPDAVDLTGWRIADRAKHTAAVPSAALAAGATLEIPLSDGVQLGNHGGAITLLDAHGLKVDGVAYTAEQAQREGWTIVF
jgi:uncharacterized protein YukJ